MSNAWKVCSACRTEIGYGALHWICSVSTCNKARMPLVFCTVGCWDSHLSVLRHRDAWAVEAHAPRNAAEAAAAAPAPSPSPTAAASTAPSETPAARRVVVPPPLAPASARGSADDEVLIVVSRMKKYIRDRSQLSTSDDVANALSEHVRALCDDAIRTAVEAGRKTVLDRDVPRVRKP